MNPQSNMRCILFATLWFLFSCNCIFAQDEEFYNRVKSGDLTLEECLDRRVLEQGFDVFPSL